MPTTRPRHTITETEPVAAALEELRGATGDRIDFGELVVLGARAKLADLKAADVGRIEQRALLLKSILARETLVDLDAADEVRRTGWARP
jgi:hypothetical protein